MRISNIFSTSLEIRDTLKSIDDFKENPIDANLLPVLPFKASNNIKLIIIGQDPTVKNVKSRQAIEYTLNMDKNGSLKNYINKIAQGLGIAYENIYATNIFKYFYTNPPANDKTLKVLFDHLEPNLELLREEIASYPKTPIITLGEPVLRLLSHPEAQVKVFWDYNSKTKQTNGNFGYCKAIEKKLGRDFFPFPHQPSLRKVFYRDTLNAYLSFMRSECKW